MSLRLTNISLYQNRSHTAGRIKQIRFSRFRSRVCTQKWSNSPQTDHSTAGDHPTERHGLGLNHGFLDDVVMVSFGVVSDLRIALIINRLTLYLSQSDYGSAYIDVLARGVSNSVLPSLAHPI